MEAYFSKALSFRQETAVIPCHYPEQSRLGYLLILRSERMSAQAAVPNTLNLMELGNRDSPALLVEGTMVFVASQRQRHWLGRPAGSRPRRTTPGWCVEPIREGQSGVTGQHSAHIHLSRVPSHQTRAGLLRSAVAP